MSGTNMNVTSVCEHTINKANSLVELYCDQARNLDTVSNSQELMWSGSVHIAGLYGQFVRLPDAFRTDTVNTCQDLVSSRLTCVNASVCRAVEEQYVFAECMRNYFEMYKLDSTNFVDTVDFMDKYLVAHGYLMMNGEFDLQSIEDRLKSRWYFFKESMRSMVRTLYLLDRATWMGYPLVIRSIDSNFKDDIVSLSNEMWDSNTMDKLYAGESYI